MVEGGWQMILSSQREDSQKHAIVRPLGLYERQ